MERSKAEAVIEAILFTMGDSVEISRLAEVIEEDVKTTKSILKDMAARSSAAFKQFKARTDKSISTNLVFSN